MSRRIHGVQESLPSRFGNLAEELAAEIKQNRAVSQPMIEEHRFETGAVRVTVIWDKWDHVPQEDRSTTILRAYEMAEDEEFSKRVALAVGLTVPEAQAAGLLPVYIIPAVRKTDSVTLENCVKAMRDEGASVLFDPDRPSLRFPTLEDAEAARQRLSERLPNSEPVWVIAQEVGQASDLA